MDAIDNFCGSKFWDQDLTWNTDAPSLTPCFQKTVLIWIPCGFLLLFSPLEIYNAWRSPFRNIPWSLCNISKIITCSILIALEISIIIYRLHEENLHPADYVAPAVLLLSFCVILVFMILAKKRGIRSSGVQFCFWFLLTISRTLVWISRRETQLIINGSVYLYATFLVFYALVLFELFLSCWADKEPAVYDDEYKVEKPCPEESSSFLNRITFTWMDRIIWKGYRNPLGQDDVWDLNPDDKSKRLYPLFERNWQKRLGRWNPKAASSKPRVESQKIGDFLEMEFRPKKSFSPASDRAVSITPTLIALYGPAFLTATIYKTVYDLLSFTSPQLMDLLINFIETDEEEWKGYFYSALLLLVCIVQSLVQVQYNDRVYRIGMRIRTALIAAIYRKSMTLSNDARQQSTVGEINNLMQVDTQRLMDALTYLAMLWSGPLQIILAIYFLYKYIDMAVFTGLGILLAVIVLNIYLSGLIRKYQLLQMEVKDQRVKMMGEVMTGMKVIKLFAWEPSFREKIKKLRDKEMRYLKKATIANIIMTSVTSSCPVVVIYFSFVTFILMDDRSHQLTAAVAFVSYSLFNLLRIPLMTFPVMTTYLAQASASLKRISAFLNSEDMEGNLVTYDKDERHAITVKDGTFAWGAKISPTLQNINVNVERGSLVAVVGAVGSGKTSLMSAILGEMDKVRGRVNISGSLAYAQQQAWIQNLSVRDNITFGSAYHPLKYSKIVDACALKPDFDILTNGDKTEIGEKGTNLSGGQKQRVSVARAVYSDADIYLFDDPLSAVDSHVGKHIFDKVIGPEGILKDKTRVLVTHGISYLPHVDSIIVLNNGEISEYGTYKELLHSEGAFAEFLMEHLAARELEEPEELPEEIDINEIKQQVEQAMGSFEFHRRMSRQIQRLSLSCEEAGSDKVLHRRSSCFINRYHKRSSSILSRDVSSDRSVEGEADEPEKKTMQEEHVETGGMKFRVYVYYLKAMGWFIGIFGLLCSVGSQGSQVLSSVWVSQWTNEPIVNGSRDMSVDTFIEIYTVTVFAQGLFTFLCTVFILLGGVYAAISSHDGILTRIFRCPMWFFDTTPTGRILNRFAKDVDVVDNTIPQNLRTFLSAFNSMIFTWIVVISGVPIIVVVVIPITILYLVIQRFYISSSRQLRRLESITRSPIYSHFGETLTGSATIRAYRAQQRFIDESDKRVDHTQKFYFPSIMTSRWLAVRLETLGGLMVFFTALFGMLAKGTVSSGTMGLMVTYSMMVTLMMSFMVQVMSALETNIVAIERIEEYEKVPEEAEWVDSEHRPPKEWPDKGNIVFDQYQTRYREGLDLVLKGITCDISSEEKIGIVGRTGAGKSSLTLALFRLVEGASGSITIDGEDIAKIGLHDLRSKLTIIPQDPVLFSGPLRMNLDPFDEHTDEEVYRALKQAHLKEYVETLPQGLVANVSEGGENMSVGQRQLVCLARALLKKTKVLILDEATAAVDLDTDALIQQTIRSSFGDCTILTIAHRLNTIMDSTRVIVLDEGVIREFDTPANLLDNKQSIFFGMAKDAGLV